MQISKLTLYKVAVPLKRVIRHASFERSESENLVVKVTLEDGTAGFGEGVPRSYVTGETVESTFTDLESGDWARFVGRPSSFPDVIANLDGLTLPRIESDPRGMTGNAARCALEMAILDAYGRHFGESLGRSRRAGESGWATKEFPSPGRSIQRGHHCRIETRRAGLSLEDADLRVQAGKDQGGQSGAG